MDLLNANSYQKGAWFLHMLRKKIGDEIFWKSIRSYYQKYKYNNALTKDFQTVVEKESGVNMELFFNQWLYQAGHPKLAKTWTYSGKKIDLQLIQTQSQAVFEFPLDIMIVFEDGSTQLKTFYISKTDMHFNFKSKSEPTQIMLDPNCWLLFEEVGI